MFSCVTSEATCSHVSQVKLHVRMCHQFEAVTDAVLQQGEALGNTENTTEVGKAQFVCKPTITNITSKCLLLC